VTGAHNNLGLGDLVALMNKGREREAFAPSLWPIGKRAKKRSWKHKLIEVMSRRKPEPKERRRGNTKRLYQLNGGRGGKRTCSKALVFCSGGHVQGKNRLREDKREKEGRNRSGEPEPKPSKTREPRHTGGIPIGQNGKQGKIPRKIRKRRES